MTDENDSNVIADDDSGSGYNFVDIFCLFSWRGEGLQAQSSTATATERCPGRW